jgi:hypothetical protein
MGATAGGSSNDFSDTPPADTTSFELDTNLYFNGAQVIPFDPAELINFTDDPHGVVADPRLPGQGGIVLPRWRPASGTFADGSTTIAEVFRRLVRLYGGSPIDGPLVDAALAGHSPADDILGHPRDTAPDLGAVEVSVVFADGFESGDGSPWSGGVS